MRRIYSLVVLVLILVLLTACASESTDVSVTTMNSEGTITTAALTTTFSEETDAETTEVYASNVTAEPEKTAVFHVDGVSVDDMILYFNEVVLDSEFENSGDSSLVQKWTMPIKFMIHGECTDKDSEVLADFVEYLNSIEGFPQMYEVYDEYEANLNIYFCTGDELVDRMGDATNYEMLDGAVTFWYDYNEIYSGTICYRNDIEQEIRDSVIIEEIYNGLGPVQDTDVRVDSIIYSGFTTPQEITEVDDVILRLLYHPDIKCGMNADDCADVIRNLYY